MLLEFAKSLQKAHSLADSFSQYFRIFARVAALLLHTYSPGVVGEDRNNAYTRFCLTGEPEIPLNLPIRLYSLLRNRWSLQKVARAKSRILISY